MVMRISTRTEQATIINGTKELFYGVAGDLFSSFSGFGEEEDGGGGDDGVGSSFGMIGFIGSRN